MKTITNIKTLLILALVVLLCSNQNIAQNVGIGETTFTPDANAMLEVQSDSKGFLPPRLALIETTNFAPLTAHVDGMVVYNTATANDVVPGLYVNDGTKWVALLASGNGCPPANVGETLINYNGCFYVKTTNEPGTYTWANAITKCNSLGSGWYLPNKMELDVIYQNWNNSSYGPGNCYGGSCPLTLTEGYYWSSGNLHSNIAWSIIFGSNYDNGKHYGADKNWTLNVRCVRR